MFSDQTNFLFYRFSEILKPRLVVYGIAILVGVFLGGLSVFISPIYFVIGIAVIVFAYLLFFKIEVAVIVALLILEYLRDFNFVGSGTPFHPNGLMGIALIIGAIYFFLFNKIDFSHLVAIKYFVGFFIVSLISLAFAGDRLMDGVTVTLRLASAVAIYAVLVYKIDSMKKVMWVIGVIVAALVWPTLLGLYMIALGEGERFHRMETARLGGGTSGPGVYLAMIGILCLVFFLNAKTKSERILWGGLTALFTAGLFFSYARAGWIGFLAGLLFIGLMQHRKLLLILPLLVIFSLMFIPAISQRFSDISSDNLDDRSSSTLAMRVELWRAGIEVYKTRPLLGVGYGVDRYRIGEYLNQYSWMAHNDYIGVLVGTGLVGFIIFLFWHSQWLLELFKVYHGATFEFDKTIALAVLAVFAVSMVVRITDNIVQSTGRMYPLVALVAITFVIPRIRAEEDKKAKALLTTEPAHEVL